MIVNLHSRLLHASAADAGALIDGLGSDADRLWPGELWPPMRFAEPLAVGVEGGHGPARYAVEDYRPGRRVRFRFTAPAGFDGTHGFGVEEAGEGRVRLVHRLEMEAVGPARLSWPLVFRPLHDALIKDALDKAAASLGGPSEAPAGSARVRALRWCLGRRRGARP